MPEQKNRGQGLARAFETCYEHGMEDHSPWCTGFSSTGDTVNTSARLEANAPGGTIYISRAVADALAGRVRTASLGGSVKLKGKKEGFEVLTLDEILTEEKL